MSAQNKLDRQLWDGKIEIEEWRMHMSNRETPIAKITNETAGAREAEIMLYAPISPDDWMGDISAKAFADQLKSLGQVDKITCRINCPGGVITEALAIYNMLKDHPAQVSMQVDGIAASSASFVMMAADPGCLKIAENALVMIHNAQGATFGDNRDHTKTAEILQKMDQTIAGTYAARSGRKTDTFLGLMADETWMTAKEALDNKLCDEVVPSKRTTNKLDRTLLNRFGYKHVPPQLTAEIEEAAKEPTGGLDLGNGKDYSPTDDGKAARERALRLIELESEDA